MNTQTASPPFAHRGGRDDEPSPPIRAPRSSRAEEALTPKERLRLTEAEARRAGAAAEAAEAEAERERTAAKTAAQEAKRQAQDLERQEQAWEREADRQVMRLEDRLRQLMAAKVATPEVGPGDRGEARSFLHGMGIGQDEALTVLDRLRRCDTHLGALFQIQQEAVAGLRVASQHASDELLAKLDNLECRCFRELVKRCQAIAGELEVEA